MKKTVKYIHLAVSTTAIAALIIARGKLAGHNYDIAAEGWIMLICLSVLFMIAVYNLSERKA